MAFFCASSRNFGGCQTQGILTSSEELVASQRYVTGKEGGFEG